MKESYLEINAAHLKENFNWYKSQAGNGFVCPMIKANAYGVGAVEVFKTLRSSGAEIFGVVRLSEAQTIRNLDSKVQILLFNPCDENDFKEVVRLQLTPVISNIQGLKDLSKVLLEMNVVSFEVHLEFDTGMNRLGFKSSDLQSLFQILKDISKVKVAGIFSHLVQAEDWPDPSGRSASQVQSFSNIVDKVEFFLKNNPNLQAMHKLVCHFSSSKAINDNALMVPHSKDLLKYGIRPGLGLYGISQKQKNLKSVLTLKAPIIDVKWCEPGETVSYDGEWIAKRPSLIATLPLGYGDGYPRSLQGQTHVLIDGQRAFVVGKICMDFIMIDLTDIALKSWEGDLSSLQASDLKETYKESLISNWMTKVAVVFGEQSLDKSITIEALAEKAGLITYEFLVHLNPRLKRKLVGL